MTDYSYYSHGPLVPFIVAYMIWGNKDKLAQVKISSCWLGYPVIVLSALVYLVAIWTNTATLQALEFMGLLFGAILLLGGIKTTKILSVPVFFMLSMMPISPNLLDSATNKLQLYSAAFASQILQWSGYATTLQGTSIYADGLPQPLIVGIPCSGLRTLISLLTFTVFFIYIIRTQWWKRAILLALAFPLSMFVNSIRIAMIGYSGFWTGSAETMHKFHDYSGYLGLIICFGTLFVVAKILGITQFGFTQNTEPQPSDSVVPGRRITFGEGFPGAFLLTVLFILGLSRIWANPIYPQTKGHIVTQNIPISMENWTGQDMPIETLVRNVLRKADLMNRNYIDNSEYSRQVNVFISASRDPNGFHDPHECLPSNGTPISKDSIITLRLKGKHPVTVKATQLLFSTNYGDSIVIYWYMRGTNSWPGTGNIWNQNRLDMLNDLKFILMHPLKRAVLKKEIEGRQFTWYRFSTDVESDPKTDIQFLKKFIIDYTSEIRGFGEK